MVRTVVVSDFACRVVSVDQFAEHTDDPDDKNFARLKVPHLRGAFGDQSVETCRTLGGRAAGIVEELGPRLHLSFPVAFSNVEQDGQGGTVKVIADGAKADVGIAFTVRDQVGDPAEELQGDLVDFETFVIKD